ncbi:MAG: DUF4270 family protein [Candidatus Dadabacteria bacterium]
MKKSSLLLFLALGFILVFLGSCSKINEATEVGGDLIPAVDNITTFDTTLSINSTYAPLTDTNRFYFNDVAAIGKFNDPVFGSTTANAYFNLSSQAYGVYPYQGTNRIVDSVVLSLSYQGSYGDTAIGNLETFSVYEIDPNAPFRSDTVYQFNNSDFQTTGAALGTVSFNPARLSDSVYFANGTGTKNVLRIKLNNSFGQQFLNTNSGFDTSATGAYHNDSLFHTKFKGLAVKGTSFSGGNGSLGYFSLSDNSKTYLTVYYRATINNVDSATSVTFIHTSNGQANLIQRQPAGDYANYLAAGNSPDGRVFLQSSPGSYIKMLIPGLDIFKTQNKLIHRAELIVQKVPSTADNIFTTPSQLMLDAYRQSPDTAFLLHKDLSLNPDGSVNFGSFGGSLRPDNTYRFTITRYIQGLVTEKNPNYMLRLYAPLRTSLHIPFGGTSPYLINVNSRVAAGRAVLAGGNYTDVNQRMRLHIIYSKL